MKKLKTLKDLRYIEFQEDILERVKQEAIKWVKEPNEHGIPLIKYFKAEDWLKLFFNITEEDLK